MSRKVIRDRSQLAAAMSVACAITAGASLLQLSRLSIPPAVVPSVAGVATGIVLVGGGVNGWRHGLSVGDAARAAWRDTPLLVGNVAFLASVIVPGAGVARTIGASLALTGVAFSLAAHLLLPPPVFDKPSGSYSVGTKAFTTELPGGRRVMVQTWYPASGPGTARARLWTGGSPASSAWESQELFGALTRFAHLPSFSLGHMLTAYSHSEHDAPLASSPASRGFPLVVVSHGLYGFRFVHSALCSILASEGCVVAAIDHHPDALHAVFPADRETIPFAYPEPVNVSQEEVRAHWSRGLERRVADLRALLDLFGAGQGAGEGPVPADTPTPAEESRGPAFADLAASTSIESVGVVGHSYGGGTAVALSKRDSRVALVVALDSWLWPVPDADYDLSHSPPALLLSADLWGPGAKQWPWRRRITSQHAASRNLVLRGTGHQNYCDIAVMASPFVMRGGDKTGPAPPHRVFAATAELAVAWIRAHHPLAGPVVRAHDPPTPSLAPTEEFLAAALRERAGDMLPHVVDAVLVHGTEEDKAELSGQAASPSGEEGGDRAAEEGVAPLVRE